MSSEPYLIDTHCHVHESEFIEKFGGKTPDDIFAHAIEQGVKQFVCVGTSVQGSIEAIEMSIVREDCTASIALHPHEVALKTPEEIELDCQKLAELGIQAQQNSATKLVAVGECGLDYYYHESEDIRERQKALFRWHIELAKKLDVPMIFHIREAFDDFFTIIDEFGGVRGVIHSFTAGAEELEMAVDRGLYIGINGIMTFTKDERQLEAAKSVPLSNLLFETDAPFLTPKPFRGIMCEPKHLRVTAEFMSELTGVPLETLMRETTRNAQTLFGM